MQQKTIIQLWGTAGSGKTETIKIAKEELIINYINPSHSYALPLPKGEINVTLTCNGLKVGIESMGDYLRYGDLNNRLNTLIPYCDIILCASRVRNDVAKRIEELANTHNYRLLKVTNYRGSEPPFSRSDLNQLSAKHIVDLINQIISGAI
ncbi:MAG: hypothetical protein COB73_03735 [Flavobacteriaceae bacterium]|nr:MAG: hypothetical protein COB73_03735 [Flavobacteriaceae bacterium]